MEITRSEYITVEELNLLVGGDYTDDQPTKLLINEASELIDYHTRGNSQKYDQETAPNDLKIATADQVRYNQVNYGIDLEWASGQVSVSTGKTSFSKNTGERGSAEYKKISPKAQRHLLMAGLISRYLP